MLHASFNASRGHRINAVEIARRAQKEAETSISRGSNHCVLITRRLLSSDWLVIPPDNHPRIPSPSASLPNLIRRRIYPQNHGQGQAGTSQAVSGKAEARALARLRETQG